MTLFTASTRTATRSANYRRSARHLWRWLWSRVERSTAQFQLFPIHFLTFMAQQLVHCGIVNANSKNTNCGQVFVNLFSSRKLPSIQLKTATNTPATDRPKTARKHEYNALCTISHLSDESKTNRTATEIKTKTMTLVLSGKVFFHLIIQLCVRIN